MKLRLSLIVSAVMLAVSSQTAVFAKDGTYTATTLGRNGDVTVQVRILNNKIEDVKVLNWSETHPICRSSKFLRTLSSISRPTLTTLPEQR